MARIVIAIIDLIMAFYMSFSLIKAFDKDNKKKGEHNKTGIYATIITDIFIIMNIIALIYDKF